MKSHFCHIAQTDCEPIDGCRQALTGDGADISHRSTFQVSVMKMS